MDKITFKINDELHSVGSEVSSDLTLLDYIRNVAELRGTKYMCREGGCGACIVGAVKTPGTPIQSVNSCLVSVTSCQGWEVTTVEKVGNKLDGYSPVQTTLAEHHGSQCGYCSPGWVMAMHSLIQGKKNLTPLEIEKSFGSNICRCTGYRPIMDAFKKFATDSQDLLDIEELKICKKTGEHCANRKDSCEEDDDWCLVSNEEVAVTHVVLSDGRKWYRVNFAAEIFTILNKEGNDSYMLISGNTAKGAYPMHEYPMVLIDISSVNELKGFYLDQNLVIGSGVTLSELLDIFESMYNDENFMYLKKFYDHLNLVAHIAVRNLGSIAGNLMIKHQHNEFPSDIFLLLETVGAQLTLLTANNQKQTVTMQQFLKTNMKSMVILNILLPPLSSEYLIATYKIMPKAQNAHATLNAGFLYRLSKFNKVIKSRIVYGGLAPTFTRAVKTEILLVGKNLFANETLQAAIKSLNNELVVQEAPPAPAAAYRKQLAINLFYKSLLSLSPAGTVSPRYQSGSIKIKEVRPVSEGSQVYDTNKDLWPINQPVQKLEALIQCSGEAPYSEDLPSFPREVFAEFVLSTVSSGNIVSIDPSKALNNPGVIAFYSSKDIPGVNSFTPSGILYSPMHEEILATDQIMYFNQPIGIIVADTHAGAERAAKLVTAKYKNVKKSVVIDIKEAKEDPKRNTPDFTSTATEKGTDVAKVIKGECSIYSQYHLSMETLVCVSKPTEEGLEVHTSTQWVDAVQQMTAEVLKIDANKVDVYVRRLGGAFGLKVTRAAWVAVACSLVASKLNRPCRFIQSLSTNMRAVGKRLPCSREFEVITVNKETAPQLQFMAPVAFLEIFLLDDRTKSQF